MRLPTGITKHGRGFRVFVRVHQGAGGLKSKVFPATATLTAMKQWREDTRVAARKQPTTRSARGTLSADIDAYLKLVAAMPSLADRRRDLEAWRSALGTKARAQIARVEYQLVLTEWKLSGGRTRTPLAASTVNHRRTALMHLYTTLDGRGAPNPLRDISPFAEPPPSPRALPIATVTAILDKLAKCKTRARLKVLAWTGIRGRSELGPMTPAHVDLAKKVCWVPTGKGGQPRQLVLNAEGVAAWQEFAAVKAWGRYSKDSLRRSFRRAVAKVNADRAKAQLPPLVGLRPYDLRHSIATALITAGADLADVQQHLGHSSMRMTRRYAPYQPEKLRRAIDGIV